MLKRRMMTFFTIFRQQNPKKLQYHFGENIPDVENPNERPPDGMPAPISNDQMNNIFEGEDIVEPNIPQNLKFLQDVALDIAEDTFNESDCTVTQLTRNLISLIGQKSVEMNMLSRFITMNCDELMNYYTNIFNNHAGIVQLEKIDIEEAAESVRRSRKIILSFREAREFEENFIKNRSRIPKSYFVRTELPLTKLNKAMIFVVHYIQGKTTVLVVTT